MKKHVNANKGASFQRSHGRRDGSGPSSNSSGRERNVGHRKAEEHSRTQKGNRDGRSKGFFGLF
jgi:hypothetical protein